jgi:hypothetical protein
MKLLKDTFILYAMRHYDNPHCLGTEEFNDDLDRISYIKRLFKRYNASKNLESLRIRLVLNHLITFYNVFEPKAATEILFFKLDEELWPILKTFLIYLGYFSEQIEVLQDQGVYVSDIAVDVDLVGELRSL